MRRTPLGNSYRSFASRGERRGRVVLDLDGGQREPESWCRGLMGNALVTAPGRARGILGRGDLPTGLRHSARALSLHQVSVISVFRDSEPELPHPESIPALRVVLARAESQDRIIGQRPRCDTVPGPL